MGKTILIVDDFKNTRYVTRTILERDGFNILEADDGDVALNLFDGQVIDLLITDYNMPNMSGFELTKEVKKLSQYKYMPILLLTTETDENKKQEIKNAGITGWIQKPFDFKKFVAIVKKSLR